MPKKEIIVTLRCDPDSFEYVRDNPEAAARFFGDVFVRCLQSGEKGLRFTSADIEESKRREDQINEIYGTEAFNDPAVCAFYRRKSDAKFPLRAGWKASPVPDTLREAFGGER